MAGGDKPLPYTVLARWFIVFRAKDRTLPVDLHFAPVELELGA